MIIILYRNKFDHKKKNLDKTIRTILQLIIIALLLMIIIPAIFFIKKYEPLDQSTFTNKDGFIALSYFGVDRNGDTKYVSKDVLEKQLTLLKEQGFETISQQQIIDFYEKGTPLPEKALFLAFEDGRNDSSIFTQPTLEKLNYKATMYTYANKMNDPDTKFIKPNYLKDMENSGFWELGSNGYRLTYINIFNDEGDYLGTIDEKDIPNKTDIEFYNHYLMDYIRDEYMVSKETTAEMENRIANDYELLKQIYLENFNYIPKSYAIMHADALYYNMDQNVEQINDFHIKDKFSIHFNRDKNSFNGMSADLYDLTRLQVAPYWPTNHLFMKIQQDSQLPVEFDTGDSNLAKEWSVKDGVAEFTKEKIIVTTYPSKEATLLYDKKIPKDSEIHFKFQGNVVGKQYVGLNNVDNNNSIQIELENNELTISEYVNFKETVLDKFELNEINWNEKDYAFSKATNYDYWDTQKGSRIEENEYPSNILNDRNFNLTLLDNTVQVIVDNNQAFKVDLTNFIASKDLYLSFGGSSISQGTTNEQYRDTIYDAIISNITIKNQNNTYFTNEPTGTDQIVDTVSEFFDETIDFFIETF